MTDRETRLRSLLDKVRTRRPEERETRAADVLERVRTASGSVPAAGATASERAMPAAPLPEIAAPRPPAPGGPSTPVPSRMASVPSVPAAVIESPTRYSSQPPRVERPLEVESRGISSRPEAIRPQSVAPASKPVVRTTDAPEFARPKTFGDLLELTLSLRPR